MGGDYPVADLDVFYVVSSDGLTSDDAHRFVLIGAAIDYEQFLYVTDRWDRAYTIVTTERKDMLNTIGVQLSHKYSATENYMTILEGFDLNCCQVGLDLQTGELLIVRSITAEFLDSGSLAKAAYPATPLHTAIRLAKKHKELGCYCDYDSDDETSVSSAARSVKGSRRSSQSTFPTERLVCAVLW